MSYQQRLACERQSTQSSFHERLPRAVANGTAVGRSSHNALYLERQWQRDELEGFELPFRSFSTHSMQSNSRGYAFLRGVAYLTCLSRLYRATLIAFGSRSAKESIIMTQKLSRPALPSRSSIIIAL
jgi:hypothetical protein